MTIELHEFEALGGEFSEEKMIKQGFRYQLYIGKLTIGNAKCIGYVKKMKNGAFIITRMKNITENNVVNKLHTVAAVLEHYLEKEEKNEEILQLQTKRKIVNFFAFIFQIVALTLTLINLYHYYFVQSDAYLILAGMGLIVYALMIECRYRILGVYLLRRKSR